MACIWMDGEEIQFAADSPGLWDGVANNAAGKLTYVSTHPRTGSGGFRVLIGIDSQYSYKSKTLPSTYTELYHQFGLWFASTTSLAARTTLTLVPLLTLKSSTSVRQITLGINESSQVIEVYRGANNGTLLGSGSTPLAADEMNLIELRVVISDTVGVVQVKLNGVLEIDLSNQDTNNAGGGDIKSFDMGVTWNGSASSGASIDAFFDDIIVNDTTGTVANSWPNGAGIEKLDPNADGDYTAWTSTGGTVDYTEVDDVATYSVLPDDDTTTILSSTTNQRTAVNLDNTTQSGTVEAAMLVTYAKNSAAGADQMAQSVRLNAVDYDQTAFIPATSYGWHTDILTLNPATAARWTTGELNGAQLGWKRVT